MTTYYLNQSNVTQLLDSVPALGVTSGEGNPGQLRIQDDYVKVAATNSPITQAGGSIRMCRIPTGAKVKSVVIAETTELDTHNTATLVFDLNMAFSDAPLYGQNDGTPLAYAGQAPTTVGNAVTVISSTSQSMTLGSSTTTTAPAYSSPNILFGQIAQVYNAVYGPTDVVFNGTNAQNTGAFPTSGANVAGPLLFMEGGTLMPLWAIFGFSNAAETLLQDPGGYFDLVLYVSTAATTAAAGYIYGKISFVI